MKENSIPEAAPNATYNAKVHEIAEILNNKYWEECEDGIPPLDTEKDDPELWKQARAMVAKMADCYIAGYMSNCDEYTQEGIDLWAQNATAECVERGLIPNTKPTDNV